MPEPLLDLEDLEVIEGALLALDDAEEGFTRAAQAGFDFKELKERMDSNRGQLQKIKQAFFPGR